MSELKALERLLAQGKISRREFLTRISALGLATTLPSVLVPSAVHALKPQKGGRFRLGLAGGSTTDSLDPATITDAMVYNINWQIRNCLTEVNQNGELVPELASSWESSPDAKKWIFKLRRGVEFHNGKTLVANDVIFSINHHRGQKSKSAAKGIVDSIENLKADGQNTVVFNLKEGNADFPFSLSDPHLTIVPVDTEFVGWEKGIGTGGYILENWERGYRAFTKRNLNYWKEGRAHFDEVATVGIPDVTTRVVALNTRQIDVMNRFQLNLTHLLEKTQDIQVINLTGTKHYSMPMLTDRKPYSNNDVRLALKYAINRKQLLEKVVRGYGKVGNDHPIAPCQKWFASELKQRTFDPDKAKFHMKKAGMLDFTFRLHVADIAWPGVDAVNAAMLYKKQAAQAGIKIEIVIEPDDGYWDKVWMRKPWVMCYWGGRATADWMLSTAYAANSPWNDTSWKHKRFNGLLKEARAETNPVRREELYHDCQRILNLEGGVIIPLFANIVEAASKRLNINKPAGNWEMDGYRAAERWWFKA